MFPSSVCFFSTTNNSRLVEDDDGAPVFKDRAEAANVQTIGAHGRTTYVIGALR